MVKAILTGFEPFGPYKFNPVQDITEEYDGQKVGDIEICGLVLPSTYYGAFDLLSKKINQLSPNIILSTGLASRVKGIRFETTGRNIMNGKYPDAKGFEPKNKPIIKEGKAEYKINVNVADLKNLLSKAGIPVEISNDAEGFICNSLLYLTLRKIHEEQLPIKYVYFHIPWTDDYLGRIKLEKGKITIKKQDLRRGIEILLKNM